MSIVSPCNKTCVIDPERAICIGCGRTGDEIASWLALSDQDRQAVMLLLPGRLDPPTAGR